MVTKIDKAELDLNRVLKELTSQAQLSRNIRDSSLAIVAFGLTYGFLVANPLFVIISVFGFENWLFFHCINAMHKAFITEAKKELLLIQKAKEQALLT